MPNIKSARKRMKTSAEKQVKNRATKASIATERKKLYETIASGNETAIKAAYNLYSSMLDKAVKHGILKANTASRGKSRITLRLAKNKAA